MSEKIRELLIAYAEDCFNYGRNGKLGDRKPDPYRALAEAMEALESELGKLRESQTYMRRILAALVVDHGHSIAVSDIALAAMPLNPEILTWHDDKDECLHIDVQK